MNEPLSEADLHAVRQILVVIEDHLSRSDDFEVNWSVATRDGGAPEAVWDEVVRQAREAGWDATKDADVVRIRRL
jgi:hypothetical protein